jgi:hypothetical protein
MVYVICIFLVILIILLFRRYEAFHHNSNHETSAKILVANKSSYKNNSDTFRKFKRMYHDGDIVEYYDVRPILQSCEHNCVEQIMSVID